MREAAAHEKRLRKEAKSGLGRLNHDDQTELVDLPRDGREEVPGSNYGVNSWEGSHWESIILIGISAGINCIEPKKMLGTLRSITRHYNIVTGTTHTNTGTTPHPGPHAQKGQARRLCGPTTPPRPGILRSSSGYCISRAGGGLVG